MTTLFHQIGAGPVAGSANTCSNCVSPRPATRLPHRYHESARWTVSPTKRLPSAAGRAGVQATGPVSGTAGPDPLRGRHRGSPVDGLVHPDGPVGVAHDDAPLVAVAGALVVGALVVGMRNEVDDGGQLR